MSRSRNSPFSFLSAWLGLYTINAISGSRGRGDIVEAEWGLVAPIVEKLHGGGRAGVASGCVEMWWVR